MSQICNEDLEAAIRAGSIPGIEAALLVAKEARLLKLCRFRQRGLAELGRLRECYECGRISSDGYCESCMLDQCWKSQKPEAQPCSRCGCTRPLTGLETGFAGATAVLHLAARMEGLQGVAASHL